MPRNHGDGAWIFLSSFGGGLVDGDHLDVDVDAAPHTLAFMGTQASTKVYRSNRGTSQNLRIRAAAGAAVALMPDPVVAFAGARYSQRVDVSLGPGASLVLLDSYTCGRAARGERWQFARFESRTTVARDGRLVLVDSTRLDPAHGAIADRMAGFGVIASVVALGPRFAPVRAGLREMATGDSPFSHEGTAGTAASQSEAAPRSATASQSEAAPRSATALQSTSRARMVCSASLLGDDGIVLRLAADHFENAFRALRPCFGALARVLGDDPFARKW